jgi:UPF0271 protein
MTSVDLNCDVGESFGTWRIGDDENLLRHVTSASIACGFHGGDPRTMRRTVALAVEGGVAVGAHPGYPDLAGFGRRAMDVSPEDVRDLVVYQVGAIAAFAAARGTALQHVKPHGALYNVAAARMPIAEAIAQAIAEVDKGLVVFALAGSALVTAARAAGLAVAEEGFIDRRYQGDGSLVDRRGPTAIIAEPAACIRQALALAREGCVMSADGVRVNRKVDTLCIHGDTPGAAALAKQVRASLEAEGVTVTAPGRPR